MPGLQQLRQRGRGAQRGVEQHVALACARVGLDCRQGGDDPDRPLDEMKYGVGHPVVRGRVQRERLAARDLLALNVTLDRDPLRRERVRLGRALQRLRQLQPVQRPRLARIRVDPDVERLAQQRLQLRHVQHDRLTLGHSTIHTAHPTTREHVSGDGILEEKAGVLFHRCHAVTNRLSSSWPNHCHRNSRTSVE